MRARIPIALACGLGLLFAGPGDLVKKAKKKAGAAASTAKDAAGTAAAGAKAGVGAAKSGYAAGTAAVGTGLSAAGKGALKAQEQAKALQPVDAAKTTAKTYVDLNVKTPVTAAKATVEGAKAGAKGPSAHSGKKN